ncbi:hypothetical protein BC834DRAFT_167658 [Gloeopeniophorella convolvens]|nr:hypothetical protein BC834DRAFT_167658 [Gloeopeniophorella convolvens]
MVNFNDPSVIETDFVIYIKLVHLAGGLYMWEYFTTLDYEWSYITGKRPYRRTIWLYAIGRLLSVVTTVLILLAVNVKSPINCQAWQTFNLFLSYLAFACASGLFMLRVIAIWLWARPIVVLSVALSLVNLAISLYGVIETRMTWVPGLGCTPIGNDWLAPARVSVNAVFATDVILCILQFIGLLRFGRTRTHGIWQLLYKQGLIWLVAATMVECLAAVFVNINLNGPLSLMFELPSLYAMQICTARFYRVLMDFNEHPDGTCPLEFPPDFLSRREMTTVDIEVARDIASRRPSYPTPQVARSS